MPCTTLLVRGTQFLRTRSTFNDYVNADDNFAVCNAATLDNISEDITLLRVDNIDEEGNIADADVREQTFLEALQSMGKIQQFVCIHDGIADLLPKLAAFKRKLMMCKHKEVQQAITDFFRSFQVRIKLLAPLLHNSMALF